MPASVNHEACRELFSDEISAEHDITRQTEVCSDVHHEIMVNLKWSKNHRVGRGLAFLATRLSHHHVGVGGDDDDHVIFRP